MLEHDVTARSHLTTGQLQIGTGRPSDPITPAPAPVIKRGAKIPQALQGVEIRPDRDHDVVRRGHSSSVDGPEIGADIHEHDLGVGLLGRTLGDGGERGHHAKVAYLPLKAPWPGQAELLLSARQQKVTRHQPEVIRDLLDVGLRDPALALEQGC
ncbi:MAG TPA: hypothetical protein VK586_25875 [Streptosporangiaceae bacterium]|nr:hypothetical protein [Streptosporangiaceae bacterium]